MTYDTRAYGDLGWQFVNAGELYRKLEGVPQEDQSTMLGLFKQATFGDCQVDAARKDIRENKHREAWLKFKGVDNIDAMKNYIERANELAKIYRKKGEDVVEVNKEQDSTEVTESALES